MPGNNPDIQAKLQLLRKQYAQKLPARITALEQQCLTLNLDDPDSKQYENLIREFHSLAGSGTSYGFPQVTVLSREIEKILLDAKSALNQDLDHVKFEINTRLSKLKQAATAGQT